MVKYVTLNIPTREMGSVVHSSNDSFSSVRNSGMVLLFPKDGTDAKAREFYDRLVEFTDSYF